MAHATLPPVRPAVADTPTGNVYDKYGSANPIERRLMGRFLRRLDELLPAGPAGSVGRILEVGTGEGHIAVRVRERYPAAFVVGVDLPDGVLAAQWRARELAGVFAFGDRLPFPDRSFDLVLAIEVLEHVPEPDTVLAEIARVARADVVLTVPWEPVWRAANMARGKYLRQFGNTPGHTQHWGRRAFGDLVARHLHVSACEGRFPWTLVAAGRR